jgi:prophage antirepressor-like protein
MNEIVKVFNDRPVRIVACDGEPWFVARDVCNVLELTNPCKALSGLDDDEKATITNSESRAGHGAQQYNIISESGLYKLVMRSRKPEAKKFVKWITAEVLPSIRKHGAYIAPSMTDEKLAEVIAGTLNDRFVKMAEENANLKAWLGFFQGFAPKGVVGGISEHNGLPRTMWRRAAWVSRFGKPYSELTDNIKRLRSPGTFTPMLPGFEPPVFIP